MPIRSLTPPASFIQNFCRYTVFQSCTRDCSRHAIPKKLLGRYGEAEFDEAPVGRGIANIDLPASKCRFSTITDVCAIQCPQTQRDAVFPWTIREIETVLASALCGATSRSASHTFDSALSSERAFMSKKENPGLSR